MSENTFNRRKISQNNRVVTYAGEVFTVNNLPTNVHILDEQIYLHQQAMNNYPFNENANANFADDEAWELPANIDFFPALGLFGAGDEN